MECQRISEHLNDSLGDLIMKISRYVRTNFHTLKAGTAFCAVVALPFVITACTGGGSSPAALNAQAPITNAGAAVSKAMSTVSNSSPQVKTGTVVTSNWQKLKSPFHSFLDLLLPRAYAAYSSLSAIWGSAGAVPLLSTQVTLPNEFFSGTGDGVTQTNQDTFTVSSANATAGATYTNLGKTYTVSNTISAGTTLIMTTPDGSPGPSGTLTLSSGTGDGTITFSAVSKNLVFSCDDTAGYCPSPGTLYNTSEALVDYVGQELSSSFKNTNGSSVTIFGRLNSTLSIGCALGTMITDLDTDGLPTLGIHSVTFPSDTSNTVYKSSSSGGCGMDTSMAGQTVSLTFTAVTGSSNYTKQASLNVGNQITLYMKLDKTNGIFNFMQIENQIGSSRYAADRTILHMTGLNSTSGTQLGFEYISAGSNCTAGTDPGNTLGNCGTSNGDGTGSPVTSGYNGTNWVTDFEFHRGFIDTANDVAYLFSSNGAPGKSDGTVDTTHVSQRSIFTASGKPNEISSCTAGSCSQKIAVGFGLVGENGGTGSVTVGEAVDSVNTTDFNGCVAVNTLAVTDDSTLTTCGVTGTNASTAAQVMDTIRAHYAADAISTLVNGASGSTAFPFTNGSDIYTAHLDF
jgi:hypothetical protein